LVPGVSPGENSAFRAEVGVAVTSGHSGGDHAGEQGVLFGDETSARPEDVGYRGPTACAAAGISYRQLDYWARTSLVEPSIRSAHGSGSQRLYGFRDILVLKVVKRLLDTGISLQQIRAAVNHLRDRGAEDLAQVTLMSDGVSVYECTSPDELVDLLAGGQGVFGIALGRVWREVEGSLSDLPAERAEEGTGDVPPGRARTVDLRGAAGDELARRRARKTG
jgi:DNA-binding transcriptional MerR regulator